jgi:hypothetical protein
MKTLVYNFLKKKFIFKETAIPKIKNDELLIKLKHQLFVVQTYI